MKPKILILTASFGDGHNSAARHLAEALDGRAEVRVADPCAMGNPKLNQFICRTYREVTTYTPWIWGWIYRSTDKQDFHNPLPRVAKTEEVVAELLFDFEPDLIVNTYPLYPYMLKRQVDSKVNCRIFTVITDSIAVNSAWSLAPTDHFLVTDRYTQNLLVDQEVPLNKIEVFGFPVSPRFESIEKIDADDSLAPFRVLFFPTARSPHVADIMKSVLKHRTELTVVLGRNVRRLYREVAAIKKKHPERVKIRGWTRKVPELLCSHHLVIGKAGGATVHEAIAAECPMLIHHVVPGQEEGNIELLSRYQVGTLATSSKKIDSALAQLLKNNGEKWRGQKQRLSEKSKPDASRQCAEFILSKYPNT